MKKAPYVILALALVVVLFSPYNSIFGTTDIGGTPTGSLGGTVYTDTNQNGIFDASENGLSGWTVNLSQVGTDMTKSITTGSTGTYAFDALSDGEYHICEVPAVASPAWSETAQTPSQFNFDCDGVQGYDVFVTNGNMQWHEDFGNYQAPTPVVPVTPTGEISGTVYNDANNNGVFEFSENGIVGWTVNLFGSTNSLETPLMSTTTDATGSYLFENLPNDTYHICEVIPTTSPVWTETAPTTTTSNFSCGDGTYGREVDITTGDVQWRKDFGNYQSPMPAPVLPATPTLISPDNGTTTSPTGLVLTWSAVTATNMPVTYSLEIATSSATSTTDSTFTTGTVTATTTTDTQFATSTLSDGAYFWHVKACDATNDCSDWTSVWTMTISSTTATTNNTNNTSGSGGTGGSTGGGNGPISGSLGGSTSGVGTGGSAGGTSDTGASGVTGSDTGSGTTNPVVTEDVAVLPAGGNTHDNSNSDVALGGEGTSGQSQVTTSSHSEGNVVSGTLGNGTTNTDQTAAVVNSGSWLTITHSLWILLGLLILILLIIFFSRRKKTEDKV